MPNQATALAPETDIVSRLARFFPEAMPLRIPIKLSRARSESQGSEHDGGDPGRHDSEQVFIQDTIIEFSTPHEVLFTVDRPLEFADRVLVETNNGLLHAEGSVVAVQYHPRQTAVAVRFPQNLPSWMTKS